MARREKSGTDAFFEAIEGLTYREMQKAAELIAMQMEENPQGTPSGAEIAEAMANAAEAWAVGGE